MALITFMSDFGYSDHYVAAVKARIIKMDPMAQVIDISHHINHFDLAHGSYVLNAVFRDFPLGTVHIAALNASNESSSPFVALKLEGYFFIGADNGLFGLISEQEPEAVVAISGDYPSSTFPEKDIFAPVAVSLSQGKPLEEIGNPYMNMKRMIGRKVRATRKQISGHVVRVDNYGNLITNIDKTVFDILSKGKSYTLIFGRESLTKVHNAYFNAEDGDLFAVFNSSGLLELGIKKGNAAELLGLHFDSPVNIIFPE